jgi:hypothetical protein
MKNIRVKGDKADLVIGCWDGRVKFYIAQWIYFIDGKLVLLPNSTTPETFLLQLATEGEAKDMQGRIICLYKGFDCDEINFDKRDSNAPRLNLSYYGFTCQQVKQAILKELKPDPLISQEATVTINGKTYTAKLQEAKQ